MLNATSTFLSGGCLIHTPAFILFIENQLYFFFFSDEIALSRSVSCSLADGEGIAEA